MLKELIRGDGCTHAPDLFWRECCDEHDKDYSEGIIPRKEADKKFFRCLQTKAETFIGRIFLSRVYYRAVRWFGGRRYKVSQENAHATIPNHNADNTCKQGDYFPTSHDRNHETDNK